MDHRICPICEVEMTNDHLCSDYDLSNFSIELELLELSFPLEPYDDHVSDRNHEHYISPYTAERNPIGLNMRRRSAPLFLRL